MKETMKRGWMALLLALAVPMCLLYEVGIIGAGWFTKVARKPEDEEADQA